MVRQLLADSQSLFDGKRALSQMHLSLHAAGIERDVVLNSDDFLTTWLNAHEFHRNIDKQRFTKAIHKIFPEAGTKAFLVSSIIDKRKAVYNIHGIIEVLRGRPIEYTYTPS
jgi:hypothetical protein